MKLSQRTVADLKYCWDTDREFHSLVWGILAYYCGRVPRHPEIPVRRLNRRAMAALGRVCSEVRNAEDAEAVAKLVGLIEEETP
jgi:hypothetical protein